MKVYGVCAGLRLEVINAAQEVIGVTMRSMCRILCENVGPTAGDLERVLINPQESQNALRYTLDTKNEIPKFFEFMQCLIGLPPLTGREFRPISSHAFNRRKNFRIEHLVQLCLKLYLPDQCWKHRHDL
jgi:hypothetical protein